MRGVARLRARELKEPARVGIVTGIRVSVARPRVWGSVCAAIVLTGLVLWSGLERPLPALGWAAAFLFFVVQQDVLRMKIPNLVTFPALFLALAHAALQGSWTGIATGLAGALLVFGVLLLPFALRGIAAGDVKALMVLGALWGPTHALEVLWWAALWGGAIALAILALRGGIGEMMWRWGHSAGLTLATGRWTYLAPPSGATAREALPFGVALALAVVALQLWGVPWATV
jgi:prepilin peptidase CpaA